MSTAPKFDQASESEQVTALKKPEEEKQVEERVAISANVVYEAVRREGEEELQRPASALAWSGVAAGLSMGFSFVTEALFSAYLPQGNWQPLVAKLGYSAGFLFVVLGRQQLFTETTLTVILPFLLRKRLRVFLGVLRLWCVVLVTNIIGAFLFAVFVSKTSVFSPAIHQALWNVSQHGAGGRFGAVFAGAIFAGWLIALMVWLLPAADSARVTTIILVTYLIGLGGFYHIIAGSVNQFYLVVTGQLSLGTYFSHFFAPTLLGNIVGGVSLVGFLNYAQVIAGKES